MCKSYFQAFCVPDDFLLDVSRSERVPRWHSGKKINLPAVQETQVQLLGEEDPREEKMAVHSSILPWTLPQTEEPGGPSPWSHKEADTTERTHDASLCEADIVECSRAVFFFKSVKHCPISQLSYMNSVEFF